MRKEEGIEKKKEEEGRKKEEVCSTDMKSNFPQMCAGCGGSIAAG